MRCWRGRGQEAPHGAAIGKGSDQTYNILFQHKDGHENLGLFGKGDGENILLPALARLVGRDFTEHGVSLVNVGRHGPNAALPASFNVRTRKAMEWCAFRSPVSPIWT